VRQDTIITCQGSDWTTAMYPKLREAGWNGYFIDAAKTLRMKDDAVIILDPVNRPVIDEALRKGIRNYIGGNCTVSLMMMALAGLFSRDLVEWMTCMTYQAASGAGAQNMRELIHQMGEAHLAAKHLLEDPQSAILDIDREVGRHPARRALSDRALRSAARGLAHSLDRQGHGQRHEPRGMEGRRRSEQDPRPRRGQRDSRGFAVRAHRRDALPQPGQTIKLRQDLPLAEIESLIAGAHEWVKLVPNRRDESVRELTPAAVTGKLGIPVGRIRKLAMWPQYISAFTVGDQLLWGAAEPLRRMLRILLAR
jgi:aspartate-semialdehyde dehydrogenase